VKGRKEGCRIRGMRKWKERGKEDKRCGNWKELGKEDKSCVKMEGKRERGYEVCEKGKKEEKSCVH
jgi:hypothetical protein